MEDRSHLNQEEPGDQDAYCVLVLRDRGGMGYTIKMVEQCDKSRDDIVSDLEQVIADLKEQA